MAVGLLVVGLGYVAFYSFLEFDPYHILIYQFTLSNYAQISTNPAYLTILGRTLSLSLLVSFSSILLGFVFAYVTVRAGRSLVQKFLLVSLFVPFFTGDIVRVFGWLVILGKNGLLSGLSKQVLGFPIDLIYTQTAVVIGLTQVMLPLAVLMIIPALTSIRRDLEYAAMNLGASQFRTMIHIVLPLSKPGLVAAFITTFTISATSFAEPDLLGGGLSDFSANAIFNFMFNAAAYPLAAATSVVLTIVISVLVFLVLKRVGPGTLTYVKK